MQHVLTLVVGEQSTIGIRHLWKEALVAILDELRMDYGIGTAEGNSRSGVATDGHWFMFIKLVPGGVGGLDMMVMEERAPHYVAYHLLENVMTEADYHLTLERVGQRFAAEYATAYTLETKESPFLEG